MKLGVVLLAAGESRRFGADKLLSPFGGRPMVCRALDLIGGLSAQETVVVARSEAVMHLAQARGYGVVRNDAPQLGQAHSIHLGLDALRDVDAALLLVGDQPRLTAASLRALLDAFARGGKGIACLQDETHRGNPAVFSRRYFQALHAITGDRGARGVLRAHEDDLLVVPCLYPGELTDADTPEALAALDI